MNGNDRQNFQKKTPQGQAIQNKIGDIKMSKTQFENTKDVFAIFAQSFDKIHNNVEKATPQYLQSYTNLQQEYLAAWSKYIHSVISVQQKYANKIGVNTQTPEAATKVANSFTDEVVKAFDVQNKIVQTALDAARQNVKTINDNSTAFAELNQNIINSWITAWNKQN